MSERYCPQTDIVGWLTDVGITRDDLQSQIDKKKEEDNEVLEAWEAGDEEQLASELVDAAVVSLGMLGLLGVDYAAAIREKAAITREKYDPAKVQAYMAEGLTRLEAFARLKQEWTGQPYLPTMQPEQTQSGALDEGTDVIQLHMSI